MQPTFQPNGNLTIGIHEMTFDDFKSIFGTNEHRVNLINGLEKGLLNLKECGCRAVYVDGSFVTQKEYPNDFDACWEMTEVNLNLLEIRYPAFFNFSENRRYQKQIYSGEFFPAQMNASPNDTYINFFQKDRDGRPKGIIKIDLNSLSYDKE